MLIRRRLLKTGNLFDFSCFSLFIRLFLWKAMIRLITRTTATGLNGWILPGILAGDDRMQPEKE